jgi:hypothetical protein
MRSQEDLRLRVLDKFRMKPAKFADRQVIDAGAGAGDQSACLLSLGAWLGANPHKIGFATGFVQRTGIRWLTP